MSSFLQTIKTKTKEVFEWLTYQAKSILEQFETWVRRIRYIDQVVNSSPSYHPEAVDIKLCADMKDSLAQLAPMDIVSYLESQTPEERGQFIEQKLLPKIAQLMGISYDELDWFHAEKAYCGFYQHEERKIAINMTYLYSDNRKLLTILVNTIVHECKHARQLAAIDGVDYGYSKGLIEEWRKNYNDYISSDENDEAYAKQPIEFDASMFANSIIDENIIFEN